MEDMYEDMDYTKCEGGKKIIDCSKRPRTQDITTKKFKIIEPTFTD